MNNDKFYEELIEQVKQSYEESITIEQAEKLAAKFLHAMFLLSNDLATYDLDARMKKSGVKAIKAAVYTDAAVKGDKKPTEAALVATVDLNDIVKSEQDSFDKAEVTTDKYKNYYNIFKECHLYFRVITKGNYNA
jgi:hypothetical protein